MTRSFRMLSGIGATLGVVAALAFSGSAAKAQTAYAPAGGGASLFSFNVLSVGSIATTSVGGTFAGGVVLSAIDFRVGSVTNTLFGYSDANKSIYTINTTTGALTLVATATGEQVTSTGQLGIDFNPTTGGGTAAAFRIVTANDENRVYNTVTNAFTPLAPAPGGVQPITPAAVTVVENAYDNNLAGVATSNQFVIDDANDSLGTLNNNGGVVTQRGSGLGVAVSVGFDIVTTPGGVNTAFALFGNDLRTIDLAAGTASTVQGTLSGVTNVRGLAVTPAIIPEAGTAQLVLGAMVLGAGVVICRRKK